MNRTLPCLWAGCLLALLGRPVAAQSGFGPPLIYPQPFGSFAPSQYSYKPPYGVMPVLPMYPAAYPRQPMTAGPLVQQVYVPTTLGSGAVVPITSPPPVPIAPPIQPVSATSVSGECGLGTTTPCEPDCRQQCRNWYVAAEALWLERSRSQRVFLGEEQVVGTAIVAGVLDTEDADFNFQPGLRVLVGYQWDETLAAELAYFGLHDWNACATLPLTDPANNALASNFLALAGGIPDGFFFNYSSELHNVELNLRSSTGRGRWALSLLGGLRYVNLREEFVLGAASAAFGDSEQTSALTNNHLVGMQIGGEATYQFGERWSLGVVGKGGLYLNFADQRVRNLASTAGVSTVVLDTATSGNNLAGSFETGVCVRCRLSDYFTVRGGYQLLFLTGLALAPEQFTSLNNDLAKIPPTITPGVTGAFLNDRGSLLFHGPSVGFEVAW